MANVTIISYYVYTVQKGFSTMHYTFKSVNSSMYSKQKRKVVRDSSIPHTPIQKFHKRKMYYIWNREKLPRLSDKNENWILSTWHTHRKLVFY